MTKFKIDKMTAKHRRCEFIDHSNRYVAQSVAGLGFLHVMFTVECGVRGPWCEWRMVRSYKVSVYVWAINKEMVSEKLNVRQININKKYYVDLCGVYCTMSPGACKLNGVRPQIIHCEWVRITNNHHRSSGSIAWLCAISSAGSFASFANGSNWHKVYQLNA